MSRVPLPCPDSALLNAIVLGHITPDESQGIAEHLQSCEQCRRALDHLTEDDVPDDEVLDLVDTATEVSLGHDSPEPVPEIVQQKLDELNDDHDETPDGSIPDAFLRQIAEPSETEGSLGRLAGFELQERIGRGGMGVVYRALDPSLGRQVAIKLLKPQLARDDVFAERFRREAQAMAGINHANVITVHAIAERAGIPFIVMEFVDGESLQNRLRQEGQLPLTDVIRIGAQIADGLEAAHSAGIIHRDIKPSNILLTGAADEVRITDFGLAQTDGSSRLTRTGLLLGTPRFMAPEQARGDPLDHRADLFSLGSVLYTMCVARSPFGGLTQGEIMRDVSRARVIPIEEVDPTLPAWLTSLVRKLHAPDPDDRFASAGEVAEILKNQLQQLGLPDDPTDTQWLDVSRPRMDGLSSNSISQDPETRIEGHAGEGDSDATVTESMAHRSQLDAGDSTQRRIRRRNRWWVVVAGAVALVLAIPAIGGWLSEEHHDPESDLRTGGEEVDNERQVRIGRPNSETGDGRNLDGGRNGKTEIAAAARRDHSMLLTATSGLKRCPRPLKRRLREQSSRLRPTIGCRLPESASRVLC